jgi:IS30 family transposase
MDCQQCQQAKVTTNLAAPQLYGPLPTSASGHMHLFTILDRSTRCAEAIPLQSTLAKNCTSAMIVGWIACFGAPELITSDRGRQFCSSLWDALTHRLGVQMRFITPYHL